MKIKAIKIFLWSFLFFGMAAFIFHQPALASSIIDTKFTDFYFLDYSQNVTVQKEIGLVNTTAEMYVSEYELAFSNYDRINSLSIYEDNTPALFTQTRDQGKLKIRIKLKQPAIGKGATKIIKINYQLNSYLNQSGIHRELLIPLSRASPDERLLDYQVRVIVPVDYPKVGISKPRVNRLEPTVYQWDNPDPEQTKALYLSFGERAYYQVKLNYLLTNPAVYNREISIPLVPDGTFQKAYLGRLEPVPTNVYLDEDGNLMAKYQVPSQSVLKIEYHGYVELYSTPREEIRDYQASFQKNLTNRYLTQEKYWFLSPQDLQRSEIQSLEGSLAIYDYVVGKLDYDKTRINQDLKRQGAQWIFNNPNRAVCMEYTDLFIALAREKGIASREVIGYGLTSDDSLLPRSFLGDILHAWPEYYDHARQRWLAIDPTWGDTSGIDYFRSFDLSHIAFVYHGKSTDTPLPPGVYNPNSKQRDIEVLPVSQLPEAKVKLLTRLPSQNYFLANRPNTLTIALSSDSNVIQYSVKVLLKDKKTKRILGKKTITLIEPLSLKKIQFNIDPSKLKLATNQTLQLVINNRVVSEKPYSVLPISLYFLKTNGFWLSLPFILLVAFVLVKWRL